MTVPIAVTGLGAVATNIVTLTEAAAVRTGTLTVTTVDTTAVTITQAALAGSGAFVLNATGGAAAQVTTVLALAEHASQTFNMTSTSAVTVGANSTSTAITINANNANAHVYVNSATTASVDTYIGGSAADSVTLGLGGDNFTTGGGADVFTVALLTDTAVALGVAASTALPTGNVSTAGMDVITGFSAGATILTGATNTTVQPILRNGATTGAVTIGDAAMLVGTYSAATNLFAVSIAGADTLFVADHNGETDSSVSSYRGIVLVGYVDANQNDTWGTTGTLTSVAG